MLVDLRPLWEAYNRICPFFGELSAKGRLETEHASELWRRLLSDREGFPSFNQMTLFRRMDLGFSFLARYDEEVAYQQFLREYQRSLSIMTLEELKDMEESHVGAPRVYEREGLLSSHAGLRYAFTAKRVGHWIEQLRLVPEVVMEIGPGYGGVADLLTRKIKPRTYILCDLPHNLYLSAFFLAANHPRHKLVFVDQEPREIPREDSFVFCTPSGLELVDCAYDLVINTYSLQEMTKDEIHRYMRLVSQRLSPEGFFYFVNNIGEIGAFRPSDYPFDLFSIQQWRPMIPQEPKLLHKKQHIEAVLTKGGGPSWPEHFQRASYPLMLMINAGLGEETDQACQRLARGGLSREDMAYLALAERLLLSDSPQQALALERELLACAEWKRATHYLLGIVAMAAGDKTGAAARLERALELGLRGLARARALFAQGLLCPSDQKRKEYFAQAKAKEPVYQPDIDLYSRQPDETAFLAAYKFVFPRMEGYFTGSSPDTSFFQKLKGLGRKVASSLGAGPR